MHFPHADLADRQERIMLSIDYFRKGHLQKRTETAGIDAGSPQALHSAQNPLNLQALRMCSAGILELTRLSQHPRISSEGHVVTHCLVMSIDHSEPTGSEAPRSGWGLCCGAVKVEFGKLVEPRHLLKSPVLGALG